MNELKQLHANGEKKRRQANRSSCADQKASEEDMKEGHAVIVKQEKRDLFRSMFKQEVRDDLFVLYQQMP